MVSVGDFSFVVADIPGLIEGAHLGHGLGVQFLRHIERTRLLIHLVDVSEMSGRDPAEDFRIVMEELAGFSLDLAAKPMFVAASKVDAAQDPGRIESLRAVAEAKELPFYEISSATGQGIENLSSKLLKFSKKLSIRKLTRKSRRSSQCRKNQASKDLQLKSQFNTAAGQIAQWPQCPILTAPDRYPCHRYREI